MTFHSRKLIAEPTQNGSQGVTVSAVEQLARVIAFVEQLLASIPLVADVDEIAVGQGNQRSPGCRRSTLIGVNRIGRRQLRQHHAAGIAPAGAEGGLRSRPGSTRPGNGGVEGSTKVAMVTARSRRLTTSLTTFTDRSRRGGTMTRGTRISVL